MYFSTASANFIAFVKQLLILFLCLSGPILLQAQSKSVQKIIKELNELNVPKAIDRSERLIKSNKDDVQYKELQVMMLWQILERIKFAKEELGEVEAEEDGVSNHLKSKKVIESDSLVMDEATSPEVKPNTSAPVITKKVVEQDVLDVDLIGDADTTQSNTSVKSKKRKKKRIDPFEEVQEESVVVGIDSSLIDKPTYNSDQLGGGQKKKVTSTTNNKEPNYELSIQNKQNEGDADEAFDLAFKDKDTEDKSETRDERKAKRAAEKFAAEEASRLKKISYFATMDSKYYKDLLKTKALEYTLDNEFADSASAYIYQLMVDTLAHVMNEKAQDLLEQGQEEFAEANFEAALNHYNDAMQADPLHEDIYLAIATAYDALGEDSLSLEFFNAARRLAPNTPKVNEAMGVYFFNKGDYERALDNIVLAIGKYPQKKYFSMIKRIAERSAKDFVSQWVPRPMYPHSSLRRMQKLIADTLDPWYYYQMASNEYLTLSNMEGIMKGNEKTKETYLEVVCWLYMLDSCKEPSAFQFARAMRKIGYLDCYVLITEFHHDLYPQFLHLSRNNPKKVMSYLTMLLSWEKGRFNKLKEMVKPPPAPVVNDKGKKKKKG
jgi:tetratricopeptide (TPR) repeat protein